MENLKSKEIIGNDKMCGGELELYLHIPFCVRKCAYCDFLSAPSDVNTRLAYVEALKKEIAGRKQEASEKYVTSIFFGGGTPSLLPGIQIKEIMDTIYENYEVLTNAEISMEVNPGTVDREYLKTVYEAGINRLSIGLQSPKEKELKVLGRIHSYHDFLQCYQWARSVGFCNVNVDLMSGLPEQDVASFLQNLEEIIGLSPRPEHLSVYSLIVEEGTPIFSRIENGELLVPSEEEDREIYRETLRVLEQAGYHRYEISNYAKEGFECKHNVGYWERKDYLGFGIGAASLLGNKRYSNKEGLQDYLENPLGQRVMQENLTENAAMEEAMFLGLRMMRGVNRKAFGDRYEKELMQVYEREIEKNVSDGLLEWKGDNICLTERGIDLSNYVFAQFLMDE